jgi:hypothetical protein
VTDEQIWAPAAAVGYRQVPAGASGRSVDWQVQFAVIVPTLWTEQLRSLLQGTFPMTQTGVGGSSGTASHTITHDAPVPWQVVGRSVKLHDSEQNRCPSSPQHVKGCAALVWQVNTPSVVGSVGLTPLHLIVHVYFEQTPVVALHPDGWQACPSGQRKYSSPVITLPGSPHPATHCWVLVLHTCPSGQSLSVLQ